jgi:cytochrome c oxidase subunit III
MSQTISADASHGHGHGDGPHAHDPNLQHHFDTMEQQFDAGKMGTWVFLVTEVLFFSGLFCAYAIYRSNHPEIFLYAHSFLDKIMGAINTCVLLFSSLTMAWGVRCAQLGQKNGLVACLALTILCAFGFMGIKYVEYSHKAHAGLLWGQYYNPTDLKDMRKADAYWVEKGYVPPLVLPKPEAPAAAKDAPKPAEKPALDAKTVEATAVPGTSHGASHGHGHALTPEEQLELEAYKKRAPPNVNVFFSIYFCMTGLHGIHVIIGIGLLFWLLIRAMKGEFGPGYFAPVDYVGLYWHIVDLVWIYLFPLLYLIG